MSDKKKPVRAVDVYMDEEKKSEIDHKYSQDKMSIRDLAKEYDMSFNTMMIIIGMIGYPVEPWCTPSIDKKLKYVAKQEASRVKKK